MSDFWDVLKTGITTLGPGQLGRVGGFFHQGSQTKIMTLIQQLHDDPTTAPSVKTALVEEGASETVMNWINAASDAAAAKNPDRFNDAISRARDAELQSNGTFGNIGSIFNERPQWHPHFRR